MKITLRWFRDKGRGQEAAEHVNAEQKMDGDWPVAHLPCTDSYHAECMWRLLLSQFGVNATTHHE